MSQERNNKILKVIDRYIGIPVVYLLGKINIKNKNMPENIDNIGLLATAAIGDTIIMSGAVNSLKNKYPNSKIILFCGSSNYEIAKLLDNIDHIEKLNIKNLFKSIDIIRRYKFNLWIDFGPWPRLNSLLSFFSISKYKIGFFTKNQYRHYVYDRWVFHLDTIHEHQNYMNLLKLIDVEDYKLPNVNIEPSLKYNQNKTIVLHLFAGGSKSELKQMAYQKWIEIAKYCIDKGYDIYLTGGPGDFIKLENFLKESTLNMTNLAGKLSIFDTARLLKSSKLVISIDTGIMHLASALNCNLISIHGPTSPDRWGPLGSNSYSIFLNKDCSPCISLGFETNCQNNICIQDIETNKILSIVEKII